MPQVKELLIEELQDLLHAERQLVAALPKMAAAAHHPKLREAFEKHLTQTEGQIERLEKVFELLGEKAEPKPCLAMKGLIEEGQETIEGGLRQGRARRGPRANLRCPESRTLRNRGLRHDESASPPDRSGRGGHAAFPHSWRRGSRGSPTDDHRQAAAPAGVGGRHGTRSGHSIKGLSHSGSMAQQMLKSDAPGNPPLD